MNEKKKGWEKDGERWGEKRGGGTTAGVCSFHPDNQPVKQNVFNLPCGKPALITLLPYRDCVEFFYRQCELQWPECFCKGWSLAVSMFMQSKAPFRRGFQLTSGCILQI